MKCQGLGAKKPNKQKLHNSKKDSLFKNKVI